MIACDCQKHSTSDLLIQVIASGVGTYLCFKLLDKLGCLENFKISLPGPIASQGVTLVTASQGVAKATESIEDEPSCTIIEDIIDYLTEMHKLDKEKEERYTGVLLRWLDEGKLLDCSEYEDFTVYCEEIYKQLTTTECSSDKI